MKELPNTKAYHEQSEKLPQSLRADYDQLVKWYRYLAVQHHSHPFVSYKILADLVREGWRHAAEPIE